MKIRSNTKVILPLFLTILLIVSSSGVENFIQSSHPLEEKNGVNASNIVTINGNNYQIGYMTEEKIEDIKNTIEVKDENKDYNVLVDGHGTGLAPPTEKELDLMRGKPLIQSFVSESSKNPPGASYDLSSQIYFPAVGNQMYQGSCGAWAVTYYAYGYLEAKDNGWDASSGDPNYLMSAAWTFNKVAVSNYGSWMTTNAEILRQFGCATMATMPYDDSDYYSWGDESAWREAPYHKILDYFLMDFDEIDPDLTIDAIKSFISSDTPVTFAFDSGSYSDGFADANYILSSLEYDSPTYDHAQCIVGYDDSITDDGDVGAFRVVNSWGTGFGESGYYWMTYECLKEIGYTIGDFCLHLCVVTDLLDYQPDLIATWEFSPAPTRMQDIVTLGVGPYSYPYTSITPWYEYDDTFAFPEFMAYDISDFLPYYTTNNDELFYLEIGDSIDRGTISSFLIERYVGGVLTETTSESIDVPRSTPGYVINTFMELDHELGVSLEVPENPEIYETYLINATVENFGIFEETDVELYLYLDEGIVNSATYTSLSVGMSETIDYIWTPTTYGTFNFTVYSPIVPGECILDNNFLYSMVPVYYLRNYTMDTENTYEWVDASGGTELYLDDDDYAAIELGFEFTFYDQVFTTVYLCSNGYLSFYDTSPIEYSNVPFPSMTPMHYYMIAPLWDDLYPPLGGYIYYDTGFDYWVAEWLGIYDVYSNFVGTFQVILYESGEIVFNYYEIGYAADCTIGLNLGIDTEYYNYYQGPVTDELSIRFSIEELEHDLDVTIETPISPELDSSYIITAEVQNMGQNDESDVNFYLYYDEILVNSTYISSLLVGEKKELTYNWTPAEYRTYNFTAYAPPLLDEAYIVNNYVEKLVTLHPITLFDSMFMDYYFDDMGIGGDYHISYSYLSGSVFHVDYEMDYMSLFFQGYWDIDANTRIIQNAGGDILFPAGSSTPFWIYTDVDIGDILPIVVDGDPDHDFEVTSDFTYDLPGFGLIEVWELADLTEPGGIAWYEKSTGLLIYGDFFYDGGMSDYIFDLEDTNAVFEYVTYDHDIAVYLETPVSIKISDSYTINATVENVGLNDESDVMLYLYLDEILVDSLLIPNLPIGSSQTIQYIWSPTEYRAYNFTTYALPVPLESYEDNNRKTTMVYVIDTELFDGMYIKHEFIIDVDIYGSNFTYTPYTSNLYYEVWNLDYLGTPYMSNEWLVDVTTRLMSGGSVFGDGYHTPAWIFTNVSLYDTIPISVDGDGDHDFYVARDLIYDLAGFGLVEVWELEDLTEPGGLAWYEKSTGILLNGTFFFSSDSYIFTFIDTNAELNIVSLPGSFTLTSNAGFPDDDGVFTLTWTEASNAVNYSVYRYSGLITEINGSLTLLADEITDLTLDLTGYTDGTYYFIVVAHNNYGDTLSNCIEVLVSIPPPPGSFTLTSNADSPDDDGIFTLTWTEASNAVNYSVYRYSGLITEMNGSLTLLADEITDLTLDLTGYTDGTYYYIVVAHNNYGDTLSNCLEIIVVIPSPPGSFTLTTNADSPDDDGVFTLTWTEASNAVDYSVYRYSGLITEINGSLTLLADEITDLTLDLTGYTDGTYYFIVVAHNNFGDNLSNCIEISVEIPRRIPGYNLPVFILAILGTMLLLILLKTKNALKF